MPRVATNQNGRESVRLFVQPPLCHTSIFTQPRILYGCRITESIDERRVWPAAYTYFITHRHTHTHSIKLYSSWENQGTSPCWTVCNRKSYKSLYWQTATKTWKVKRTWIIDSVEFYIPLDTICRVPTQLSGQKFRTSSGLEIPKNQHLFLYRFGRAWTYEFDSKTGHWKLKMQRQWNTSSSIATTIAIALLNK